MAVSPPPQPQGQGTGPRGVARYRGRTQIPVRSVRWLLHVCSDVLKRLGSNRHKQTVTSYMTACQPAFPGTPHHLLTRAGTSHGPCADGNASVEAWLDGELAAGAAGAPGRPAWPQSARTTADLVREQARPGLRLDYRHDDRHRRRRRPGPRRRMAGIPPRRQGSGLVDLVTVTADVRYAGPLASLTHRAVSWMI
jgi:hypothetical protein